MMCSTRLESLLSHWITLSYTVHRSEVGETLGRSMEMISYDYLLLDEFELILNI